MGLMHVQREADESAQTAEEARSEAAELLNRLRTKDMELAAAEAAREDALCQVRSDLLLSCLTPIPLNDRLPRVFTSLNWQIPS